MTTIYELRTDTHEYQFDSLAALCSDLHARFDPEASVAVYALSGGPYDEAPTPDSQYNAGKGAWQQIAFRGTVAAVLSEYQFIHDYQAPCTEALGSRFNG